MSYTNSQDIIITDGSVGMYNGFFPTDAPQSTYALSGSEKAYNHKVWQW